jgi:tRNA pseudouridine32 synthase/23S rRNA pseudouridine746 synthase/23S rRNA pseudouridine1911/1915/1917 synthase
MGTGRAGSRTVHALLNEYVRKGQSRSRNRVFIVHRLDQDTSGILLFAKNEAAKHSLQADWEQTGKTYLAVVTGHLDSPQGTISSYLAENAAFNVYSTTDPTKGKLAHTAYKLIKEQKGLSLVEVTLLTGRKHQIRVHFAEQGHPLVGDRKYGRGSAPAAELALHASTLAFTHPVSRSRLQFTTKTPARFSRLVGSFVLPAG